MGGSSGGGISSISIEKIEKAANQRLQNAFGSSRTLLFVCQSTDADDLGRRIRATGGLAGRTYTIVTELERESLRPAIEAAGLVVAYGSPGKNADFLNEAIAISMELKKQVLFVKGQENSIVPNYVLQFRIRVMSWSQLIEVLIG